MAWVRIDDQLHAHPKIRRAWHTEPAAIGLFVLSLSYASAYLTDGAIPEAFVYDQMPAPARRRRAVAALEEAGLWERNGAAWMIHDYLEYNPSAVETRAKRDWDVARKNLERDRELVQAIKARDQNRCRYCGAEVNWRDRKGPLGGTYDHVQPRGPNSLQNVVIACRQCNNRKGGRTPEEAGMRLRDEP